MKGKIGFVLGAALGYVLGSRAGRARYEQIKRGATTVWETPLVQQGVSAVKHQMGDTLDNAKAAAGHAVKAAFDAATQSKPRPRPATPAAPAAGAPKGDGAEETLV